MRLSAQEEYGLRCLLQVARSGDPDPIQITAIARREGISPDYAAKLLRVLRRGGLIRSVRGAGGGYMLARAPEEISVFQAIEVLGGAMFDDGFCGTHSGHEDVCVHSTACSIRSLWRWVGTTLERVLDDISLANLTSGQVTMPTGFASARPEVTDTRSEGAPQ